MRGNEQQRRREFTQKKLHIIHLVIWRGGKKTTTQNNKKKINGTDNKKGLNVQCGGAGRGFLHLSEAQNHQKLVAFFTNVCIQLQHVMIFQQKK